MALSPHEARLRMRNLADLARSAAKIKNWRENHKLCREHDDLAIAYSEALKL